MLDVLQGYTRARWFADMGAGITVGIVALPLAMAFAIASGLKPEAGLWTAIIGGFLVSLLGGTNVQIGGPAGAFIVIVYGIVERHGVAGLLISTTCAGLLLFALGLLRLGNLVRFVPVSIVIGFTNGIAVLIALSQVKDALGLSIAKMPGDFVAQVQVLAQHIGSINPYALGLAGACLGGLFLWPVLFVRHNTLLLRLADGKTVRSFARIPAPVVALVSLTALASFTNMPVETIGTRFGGIPQSLPSIELPTLSWDTVRQLVIPTLTIALLGAIESLLCARVADQLATGDHHRKHDPNQELMAQGVANFVVPFFGGMPVTGTIARTVTNLRSGATSPIAGIVHAATLGHRLEDLLQAVEAGGVQRKQVAHVQCHVHTVRRRFDGLHQRVDLGGRAKEQCAVQAPAQARAGCVSIQRQGVSAEQRAHAPHEQHAGQHQADLYRHRQVEHHGQ